jgi:cellulose synthase/poly-beta-1,6-N-acetylglucosamine synthase-like glycosyltransferase
MLVEKTAAGRADALNCGVNLARFRYAGVVDAGVVFEPDALLRAMSAPLKDPARVVAASSHVETRPDVDAPVSADAARQQLESIRSLMESRSVWRTLKNGLGPDRAVVVWRRDALLQMGGFSTEAVDPDLDMMRRLQTPALGAGSSAIGATVRTTTVFGRVNPRSRADDLAALARRQRAVFETLSRWTGGPGRTIAYFVAAELLTPLLEMWVVLAMGLGVASGWTSWGALALSVILLSLRRALVTSAALLLRGTAAGAPDERTLRRLLLLAPCEFVWYGPRAGLARLNGAWAFVNGHAGTVAKADEMT